MPARIGIELSALTCRVVELDRVSAGRHEVPKTRVSSFMSLPLVDLEGALSSLRGRHAVVVLWTPHTLHQLVAVSTGPYERMRAEALQVMAAAGLATVPVLSDIAPTGSQAARSDRRNILVATAPRNEVAAALRPLKDAGIEIDAVLTPAAALAALARLRRDVISHGTLDAYIAFEETESMMALVRDGQLVAARMLPWGYLRDAPSHYILRPRDEIVARLVNDLSTCRTSAQLDAQPLTQVCVCGALPELRSMAIALTEQLDVEVEPLDTLFSIDATRLPEPEEEFRGRAAGFRLAWAAATDERPTLDLLRERKRQARKVVFSQAAVVAGVAVGLGAGWLVQKRWRPIQVPNGIAQKAAAPALSPTPPRPTFLTRPPLSQPRATVPPAQPVMAPRAQPPSATLEAPTRRSAEPPVSIQPEKPVERPLAAARVSSPAPRLPAPVERPPAARVPPPPARPALVPAPPPATATSLIRQQTLAVPAPPPEAQPSPLPFEATLGTILYGPERKLAIVDGRIVQAGDDVRGARVVEITPTSVYLRDEQGRLRRLTAGGSGR